MEKVLTAVGLKLSWICILAYYWQITAEFRLIWETIIYLRRRI